MASNAAPLIPEGAKVLTHSSSAAVFEALSRAGEKVSEAICTESRPALEGLSLAGGLASKGLKVKVVADALASFWVRQVDVVIVGTDAVREDGVVNKAGTLGLALSAREFKRPIYVLAGTEKFLPSGLSAEFFEEPKPSDELLSEPPPGVEPLNLYFDLTPLELLSAVVTEEGPLRPAEVRKRLEGSPVSGLLRELLGRLGLRQGR